MPRIRFVPERSRDHVDQVGEGDFLGLDRNRAGFDLREVEDVADEVKEVGAGAVNRSRELDLLGGEVSFRIVGQLLSQDEDRVKRRTQLVRHVCEEFRLVFRRERELGRLLLDRAAGQLDLLVLAFDLDVLLGKLLRFLFELLIGLLQFLLLSLQFSRQLLRLLEQTFGLHGCSDRIEYDADARGELFEERRLQGREGIDRGQFDDRHDLIFE